MPKPPRPTPLPCCAWPPAACARACNAACWTATAPRRRHWPPDRATGRATASPPKRYGNCAIPTRTRCAAASGGWRNQATTSWAGATPTTPRCCDGSPVRQPCCSWPATRRCCGARHSPSSAAARRPPAAARTPPASPGPWPRPACVSPAAWRPVSTGPRTRPHWRPVARPWPCSGPGPTSPTRSAIVRCWSASLPKAQSQASTCRAPARCASISPAATGSSPA